MARKIRYADLFTLRKDGRYQASYIDQGRRKYIYDRDPEQLYKKLQALSQPEQERTPNFGQIASSWERKHREEITQRTWSNYEPHYQEIVIRHGNKPIEAVTAQDVSNHLTAAKSKGYSATVANTIRSLYRMIFDYAIANDYAQYNPVLSVRLPKGLKRGKRTAPTDEQIRTIFASADKPFGLFPIVLLCTGLRKSEALALEWSDVDFDRRQISVTKSLDYTVGAKPKVKPPKTDAGFRTVPIIDTLLPLLLEARDSSTSRYLFPAADSTRGGVGGGLMTLRGYEGAWYRYCEEVGFMEDGKPTVTAHNLRHGTATLMFELGVDELTTQRILGHSRIEITREIYTDLRTGQNSKSVEKFNTGMKSYLTSKQ